MNTLTLIFCLFHVFLVTGQQDEIGTLETEEIIERAQFTHVFGIEPYLRLHSENPINLFHMFYDDERDEYENITYPQGGNGNIVKVRKPKFELHPVVEKHIMDYLYKKNIPELTNYIDNLKSDADKKK